MAQCDDDESFFCGVYLPEKVTRFLGGGWVACASVALVQRPHKRPVNFVTHSQKTQGTQSRGTVTNTWSLVKMNTLFW